MWLLFTMLACLGFGVGAAMQKHGMATALPKLTFRRLLLEWRAVGRAVLRNWIWLLGVLVNLVGGGLLVLAIDAGEISIVQPLVNVNLLVAVLLGVLVLGERLRPVEWGGAGAMLLGATLVSLTAVGDPAAAQAGVDREAALVGVAVVCAALVAALNLLGRPLARRVAYELILAVSAGLLFGLGTPLIKQVTLHLSETGPDGLVGGAGAFVAAIATDVAAWGVVVVNVVGFAFYQVAFANGRVAVVAPVTTISAMAMPVAAGALAFGEPLGALRLAGIAVITLGVAALLLRPAAKVEGAGSA